jgi:cytochrome c551/c552
MLTWPSLLLPMTAVMLLAACGGEHSSAKPMAGMSGMSGMHAGDAPGPQAAASSDPRAAIFLEKGCPQCHTISALGIKSPTEIGPDLTYAYTDVQSRFSMKLEEFLHNPTGTMQVVLSSQIQLSPQERDSVIHLLKAINEEAGKHE